MARVWRETQETKRKSKGKKPFEITLIKKDDRGGLMERDRERGETHMLLTQAPLEEVQKRASMHGVMTMKGGKNNAWILSVVERGSEFVFNLSFLGPLT